MKKIIAAACASIMAISVAAVISACDNDQPEAHVHNMSYVAAVQPDCTEDGHTAYYECPDCGKYFSDEEGENEIALADTVIGANGHTPAAAVKENEVPATCTTDGSYDEVVRCSVCGEEISRTPKTVTAAGHDMTLTPAKQATCTESGNSAYYTCSVCHKYFSDEEGENEIALADTVIVANGHVLTASVVTSPTATTEGSATTACENCDYTGTLSLPMLTDANVDNGTYDYSVTYAVSGSTYYMAARNGRYTLNNDSLKQTLAFDVALGGGIRGTVRANMASSPVTVALSNRYIYTGSLDEAATGISLVGTTGGWYNMTVPVTVDAVTATLIGSDGSVRDYLLSSDNNTVLFNKEEGVMYIFVFHSASAAEAASVSVDFEQTEIPTLSLTQTCKTGNLAGGNAAAGGGDGGSVTILIDQSVAEGTYMIKLSGSALIGRYYNFVITVNGNTYNTSLNRDGGLGAAATAELKGGDMITIQNANFAAMDLTVTLTAV